MAHPLLVASFDGEAMSGQAKDSQGLDSWDVFGLAGSAKISRLVKTVGEEVGLTTRWGQFLTPCALLST